MLTKLLPDQIAKFWDIIKYAVEESLPPIVGESSGKMQRILTSCLDGSLEVWISYIRTESATKIEGIVVTEFTYDKSSGTKNLLIYCLYGYENINKDSWLQGLVTLKDYAKGRGCNQIVAYTEVPQIIELVKKLGGEARFTYITFNV